jgi:hypothetical protein
LAFFRIPAVSISRTGTVLPLPVDRDRIACDPRLRPGDQPVLLQHLVDQRRLAGIGAADDRELQGGIGLPFLFLLAFLPFDIGPEVFEQVDDAFPVLGAKGDRLAEAERIGFEDAALAGAAFGLVRGKDDRRGFASQPPADLLVERVHAGARIDQEKRRIGFADRGDGLRPHPARQRLRILVLIACRVDDAEFETEQSRIALAPVAGHARTVVDKRQLLADEAVEQGRLADIGPADDRDGGQLGHAPAPACSAAEGQRRPPLNLPKSARRSTALHRGGHRACSRHHQRQRDRHLGVHGRLDGAVQRMTWTISPANWRRSADPRPGPARPS